mmetsp:Transcript_15945/g.23924  ORF Transcript_15945/g.23924 Transcript_15945/m.23924 type:complete len:511 (-) Transcript_15945:213-1745(-)
MRLIILTCWMFQVIPWRRRFVRGFVSSCCRRPSVNQKYFLSTSVIRTAREEAMEAHESALNAAKRSWEPGVSESKEKHNRRQSAVFGRKAADYFASSQAVPSEIVERLDRIVTAVNKEKSDGQDLRILDVGIGTGNLAKRYPKNARIVGVDISQSMLQVATKCLDKNRTAFWLGDIADFSDFWQGEGGQMFTENEVIERGEMFDVAVFNACFGNVFDQKASLASAAQVVKGGGSVLVTHPLGGNFVDDLRRRDPSVVPHQLPRSLEAMDRLVENKTTPNFLRPQSLIDDLDFYLATWRRVPVAPLQKPLLVRGKVQRGYGRGSRKLGFPTANLPENLFGSTLEDLPCGVYTCWAFVQGDPRPLPAVANCGISPTFAGMENPLKIIEAHIIQRPDPPFLIQAQTVAAKAAAAEFYDKPMTLLLVGFQRPERKFPSFPQLINAIKTDVQNALAILTNDNGPLSEPDLIKLQHHPRFLELIIGTNSSTSFREDIPPTSTDDASAIAEWISPSF